MTTSDFDFYKRGIDKPLLEFAEEAGISEARTRQLARMAGTIRGKVPATKEEWRILHDAIEEYLED
jgi:hypothetical protein